MKHLNQIGPFGDMLWTAEFMLLEEDYHFYLEHSIRTLYSNIFNSLKTSHHDLVNLNYTI